MHWAHPAYDVGRWWLLPPLTLALITVAGVVGAVLP